MSAFVALDPRAHRPDFLAKQPPAEQASVLYATEIARYPEVWERHAGPNRDLNKMRKRLAASYKSDTVEIARRSKNKERRLGDAQGFLFMAMVGIGLVGLVRLPNSTQGTRALLVIVSLFLLVWALAPITVFIMQLDKYAEPVPRWDRIIFYVLPIVGSTLIAAWTLVTHQNYWIAIFAGLTAIFVTTHPSAPVVYSRLKEGRDAAGTKRPNGGADDAPKPPLTEAQKTQSDEDRPAGAKRGRLPWHAVWWGGVTVTACATMFIPGFNLMVHDPLRVQAAARSVVYNGEDKFLVCVRLTGQPYERRRVRLTHEGVLLKGFPKPLYLGANGTVTAVFRTDAQGRFTFEIRRQDTDATSVRKDIPVPSLTAVATARSSGSAGSRAAVSPLPGTPPGKGFTCPNVQTPRSFYTVPPA